MAQRSGIEWTESTWNPVTGCTKVSPGCAHCYAERMAERLRAMGQPNYRNGFAVTMHDHALELPLNWKKPRIVFVNSMSDLFHEQVEESFIQRAFKLMEQASWHTFQVLTKRAERLGRMASRLRWPPNVWTGVSVESGDYLWRIDHLRKVPARIRFISFEPLLDDLGRLDLKGIHWVIAGGESGPGARPLDHQWVRHVRDQCLKSDVPFFFKQWGGVHRKKTGRLLDGRTWDQWPRYNEQPSIVDAASPSAVPAR